MILAHHIIFGAYGFWLPNDPRGSGSDFVRSSELFRFGPATKVTTRRSVAAAPHDATLRLAGKHSLKYPPVKFTGLQARAVGRGFERAADRSDFVVYACSILPDHSHLVIARHRIDHRQVMNQFKGESGKALARENLHPFQNVFLPSGRRHTAWAEKGWTVFLNTPEAVYRAIRYVQMNPIKEGLRTQNWSFVTPFHPSPAHP